MERATKQAQDGNGSWKRQDGKAAGPGNGMKKGWEGNGNTEQEQERGGKGKGGQGMGAATGSVGKGTEGNRPEGKGG